MIEDWFSSRLADARCHAEWMPVARSTAWSLRDGFLSHRSKGFFTVVGLQWTSPEGEVVQRPFLDQREVGTLGFLIRERDGHRQLLAQAKIEPGNVGLVQLAPTCQATDSNARRLHGGDAPPFIDTFLPSRTDFLYDAAQSEQAKSSQSLARAVETMHEAQSAQLASIASMGGRRR